MSFSFLYLLIAISLNGLASSFFKLSSLAQNTKYSTVLFVAGLMFGGVNAMFYTKSLAHIKLNVAYPVFSSGCIVLITAISILFFKEPLTTKHVLGMIIIIWGIVTISFQ